MLQSNIYFERTFLPDVIIIKLMQLYTVVWLRPVRLVAFIIDLVDSEDVASINPCRLLVEHSSVAIGEMPSLEDFKILLSLTYWH